MIKLNPIRVTIITPVVANILMSSLLRFGYNEAVAEFADTALELETLIDDVDALSSI